MAERDFRLERHYEQWKDQNRQMSRWAFGTLIFATVILLKVLTPYTGFSDRVATQEAELRKVNADLKVIEEDRQALAKINERLEAVGVTIERQPWTAEKERLIVSLRELNQAHNRLAGSTPGQILDAMREESLPGPAPIGQQIPPLSRPIHPLVQAATTLRLDADRIRAAGSAGNFPQLVGEQTQRRVQEEADDKARRIFDRVNEDFIQPLERLLREDPEAGKVFPAMAPMLARTRADMDQWVRQHLGKRIWYETIQQKDQELSELTAFLRQRQEAFAGLVREQQKALEPKVKALAERQQTVQAQEAGIRKALAELNDKMQKLLPDWLRDLLSPEEMLQLYPLVLLGLVAVMGFKVGLIRHHYLVVREGKMIADVALRDGAVSSVWTLIYRGPLGTAATCAMYLGGIAMLWWLFERGSSLAAYWLAGKSSAAWAAAERWLPVVHWLGRVMFVTSAAGIVGTIVRDRAHVAGGKAAASAAQPAQDSGTLGTASDVGRTC